MPDNQPDTTRQGKHMTLLTVRQAADMAGVTRQTMYRLLDSGKLSATVATDGTKVIDKAELLRHFGALQSRDTVQSEKSDGQRQVKRSHVVSTDTQLQIEIERLKAMLSAKDVEIAMLRQRIEELKDDKAAFVGFFERAQRLLEAPGKKRFWGMFGG